MLIDVIDIRPVFIRMTLKCKEVRYQLLISHDEGVLNVYELLLLYDFVKRSNILDLPSDSFPDFNFDDLEDDECVSEFLLPQTRPAPSR